MKIPGVVYENPGVQSLGRDNVRGPLGVAKAKANTASIVAGVAQDRAQTYSKVASDMVSIGGIHQQEARMKDNSAAKTAQYAAEFGANMQNLTNKGMALTVGVIKASAERSFHDVEVLDAETMESIANGPKTMQVDGKTHGMRTVSTAGGMVSAYDAQMAKVKEDALANANPWSRGLLEGMIDDKIAVGRVEMTSFANKEEKAFYTEDVKNIIEEKLDKGDFKGAQEVATNNRDLLGKNYSTYTNAIRDSKEADDLVNQSWEATDRIASQGGSLNEQIKKVSFLPNEIRDATTTRLVRLDNIKNQSIEQNRVNAKRADNERFSKQINEYYNGDRMIADIEPSANMTGAERRDFESWKSGIARGDTVVTDRGFLSNLRKLSETSPEEFKELNPETWVGILDTQHWDEMNKKWAAANNGEEVETKNSAGSDVKVSRINTIGTQYQQKLGFSTSKQGDMEKWSEISTIVQDQVWAQPDKDWTDQDIDGLYRSATQAYNDEQIYDVDDTDNDAYIRKYMINRGITISPEAFINERERFTEWAIGIQPAYTKAKGRPATPEELRKAWARK